MECFESLKLIMNCGFLEILPECTFEKGKCKNIPAISHRVNTRCTQQPVGFWVEIKKIVNTALLQASLPYFCQFNETCP